MSSFFTRARIVQAGVFLLLLAFYATFLIFKIKLPAADDIARQIKIGEELLRGQWTLLYHNTFSYTEPDYTFYNHHWFSTIVFYILQKVLGWGGLVVFKVLLLLGVFSLIFKSALKRADFWVVAACAIPVIFILHERTSLRPEVFSYLLIALYVYLLFDVRDHPERRRVYLLVPLQLLWVNTHVFFSVGIMLVAGFLFEQAVINRKHLLRHPLVKKLAVILGLMVLVSFINPRGIEGVLYHYPSISIPISENQSLAAYTATAAPVDDISVMLFMPLVILALLGLVAWFYAARRLRGKSEAPPPPVFGILALSATAILSFFILRALAMFAFMFLLVVPTLLDPAYRYARATFARLFPNILPHTSRVLIGTFCVSLIFLVYQGAQGRLWNFGQQGVGLSSMAEGGIRFFIDNRLHGPIFNDPDIGSYLIYYLYPTERVFSDNRFGDAYSASFWDDVYLPILADPATWQAALQHYNFNVLFFYQYDGGEGFRQFMYDRINDPEWALVYADAYSIILVRNVPENQRVIDLYRITPDNAYQRLEQLRQSNVEDDKVAAADIFNLLDRVDLAQPLFLDVVTKRPENGKIWMIMGEWELSAEGPEHAFTALLLLQKALDVGYTTAEVYSFLGAAYNRVGMNEEARKALEKALDINPLRADAKLLLDAMNR